MKLFSLRSLALLVVALSVAVGLVHGPELGFCLLMAGAGSLAPQGFSQSLGAATLIGTTGTWGIASDETGLLVEGLDMEFVDNEQAAKSKAGEVIGYSFYNEMVNIQLKGLATSSSPFSGKLTATLALANAIPDHLQGAETGGRNLIRNVKKSMGNEKFVDYDIATRYCPLIAAA